MEVGREQALAFRLAAHNLHRRLPAGSAEEAAAVAGLQDLPPGGASQALAARVEGAQPGDLDALVIVYSFRGAAVAVPRRDLAVSRPRPRCWPCTVGARWRRCGGPDALGLRQTTNKGEI